jgi:cytoskeletal protein CcmA (bactofilin family)
MFRKKDAETDAATGGFRRPASDASKPTSQSDLAWRKVELPAGSAGVAPTSGAAEATAGAQAPHADADRYGKRLIVGQGIRLSGEISSCERLVVQGEVEVTLNDTLALEIAESGRFTGGCEVEEADISGVYEGDLTVRKHLCVRGTGRLSGTIRYAQLELERGGQIAGNVSVISAESGSKNVGASRALDRRSPMFTESGSEQDAPKAS